MLIQDVVSISKAQLRIESKIQTSEAGKRCIPPNQPLHPIRSKKNIAGLYTSLVRECISLLDVQI